MPRGDLKSLGLSLCLPMSIDTQLAEYEQARDRWTLMNLTTLFLVS